MTLIKVEIEGNEKVADALAELPDELEQAAQGASAETIMVIRGTTGIQAYPPATSANQPPTPYYIRGVGMQYASGNTGSSEQYGKKWTEPVSDGYITTSKNTASYASYLVEDADLPQGQAGHMALIGWRQLGDVVTEKKDRIIEIFNAWIDLAIEKLGLND